MHFWKKIIGLLSWWFPSIGKKICLKNSKLEELNELCSNNTPFVEFFSMKWEIIKRMKKIPNINEYLLNTLLRLTSKEYEGKRFLLTYIIHIFWWWSTHNLKWEFWFKFNFQNEEGGQWVTLGFLPRLSLYSVKKHKFSKVYTDKIEAFLTTLLL